MACARLADTLLVSICLLCLHHVCADVIQYQVNEETGPNHLIGNVLQDANIASRVNDTSNLEFSILSSGNNAAARFFVDARNGSIYTNESLDRDRLCQYDVICVLSLGVTAKSPGSEFFEIIKVEIEVLDINDHTPVFRETTIRVEVYENTAVNTSFSLDGAIDLDSESYSVKRYEVASLGVPFRAEADTYPDGRSMLRLIVTDNIDREKESFYQIQIFAIDGGDPPLSGSLIVEVSVLDVNDNKPVFPQSIYNATIDDSSKVNEFVAKVTAYDLDAGVNGEVEYKFGKLQSSENFEHFSINTTNGVILVKKGFIRNSKLEFRIVVEACDKAVQPLVSRTEVVVRIRDTFNDFPVITVNILSDSGVAEVSEHASVGSAIALIAVYDPDTGANGLVTCAVFAENFGIQTFDDGDNEYKITVAAPLDREAKDTYNVTVRCSDAGSPPRVSDTTFDVKVLDDNDHTPTFYQNVYYMKVRENNAVGAHILDVLAVDYDIGVNSEIKYSVATSVRDKVQVNENNGSVHISFILDREVEPQFSFYIYASDGGEPSLTGTATVILLVEDENDNAPKFREQNYSFSVSENVSINTFVGLISAYDIDGNENAEIVYALTKDAGDIPIRVRDNGSIYTSAPLDREVRQNYTFHAEAIDKGSPPRRSRVLVTLQVLDENDNTPLFVFPNGSNNTVSIQYNGAKSTRVTTLQAVDADCGQNARLAYFSNDRNYSNIFAINSGNGDIVLIKELSSSDVGLYKLEVVVKDNGQPPRYNEGVLRVVVNYAPEAEAQTYSQYYVIAIAMTVVTVSLALFILLIIFILRRKERQALNESNTRQQFIDKIKEREEAGFQPEAEVSVVVPKEVYYPPGYDFGSRQYHTLDRSKSVQVPPTIPENESNFTDRILHYIQSPQWENSEAEENERHRNQLLSLQYQQSLMKIKNVKRSHSVLTI